MFHKFIHSYMATINYILYTYAYINILLENYPTLFSYFHSYSSLSHVVHLHQQVFLLWKVCAVYACALGLTLSIFNQHYLTGVVGNPWWYKICLHTIQCQITVMSCLDRHDLGIKRRFWLEHLSSILSNHFSAIHSYFLLWWGLP